MDALVAEKVMGWVNPTWREYHQWRGNNTDEPRDYYDKRCGEYHTPGDKEHQHSVDPWICNECGGDGGWSPSTQIQHAWQVVEKFDTYRVQRLWDGDRFYFAAEVTGFEPESFALARAESAPHAICLAALRAVGVEV
jgi:Phage ABA sandwich domain